MTIVDVAGPVTDPRAHELRQAYTEVFGGAELPVPVESIAEDLLGLAVEEADLGEVSGLLYPHERRILLNAGEGAARRRFTLAHELGHWVCQWCEGRDAPVFCRAAEVGVEPEAKALEREANVFAAELLMPEDAVRAAWDGDVESLCRHVRRQRLGDALAALQLWPRRRAAVGEPGPLPPRARENAQPGPPL